MTGEVNSIDSSSESWKSCYFSIEERDFVQPLRNKHSINEGEKKNVCGVTGVCNIFLRY